jgi:predicted GNAT family acetyltransferase
MLESGSQVLLWTLDDTPVSMARLHPNVAAMSRMGPVFTPPTLRGQGYGSAVTAAAAQHALLTGAKHVALFADVANPVSNSIYQRIGFEPVARTVEIAVNRCQGSGRPRDRASARRHPRDKN